MLRKTVLMLFGFILCLIGSIAADSFSRKTATVIPAPQPVRLPDFRQIETACTLFKHNPDDSILGFYSDYHFGERTVTYFDPSVCDSAAYPFEITALTFTLMDPLDIYDPRPYKWPILLDVVVYDLLYAPDSCYGPGAELCRIPLSCDSATFAFPEAGTVTFPAPCCVERPFYIGVEYTDPGPGLRPSVTYDVSSEPDLCHIFQYYCDEWWGWYAFWVDVPGYPFFWVDGETVSWNCCPDLDNDSICELVDNCPGDYNPAQTDTDGDMAGDICDNDDDDDGIPDVTDNCPLVANPSQEDTDGDGQGDICDLDDDDDTIPDTADNCPLDPNPLQEDDDGDELGNVCDNCPDDFNPGQEDLDQDGLGDVCDDDDDGDSVPDVTDNCPQVWNPDQKDSDGDGAGDACDCVGLRGNVDCDTEELVDVSDLTRLIDYLFISYAPLCCTEEANIDGDVEGLIDISDLTALIDFLFISYTPPATCP